MAFPDFFPRRINMRVDSLSYVADDNLNVQSGYKLFFGAPLAKSATYFANVVLSTTAVALALTVAAGTILNNGEVPDATTSRWGRGLQFVGDGASTRTIAVAGWDYLGQKMSWTGTLNGATPVLCPKAFRWIDSVTFGAAADTVSVSVGYTDVLGLPYTATNMYAEVKNDAAAANAGTFVACVTTNPATATTGDVRGTYLPLTVIPNGTVTFRVYLGLKPGNLHGVAQA